MTQTPLFSKQDAKKEPEKQVLRVYLTSYKGLENWCKECSNLVDVEKTEFFSFPFRIKCSVEKCKKTKREATP